jgi:sialate O-acetylesterase
LARAARAASYGEKDLLWSGPLLEGGTLSADQAVLTFTQVGEGLVVNGDRELGLFEAQEKAPADAHFADLGEFQPVSATLSSDRRAVVLDVKGLTPPLRIRYAWGAMPRGNLYNSADLPASPFMSDPIGP